MLTAKTRGLMEFQAYLKGIERNARGQAVETITDFIIGNGQRGFTNYPPPRGQKYVRTGTLRAGWKRRGDGVQSRAINDTSYAQYVQGRGTQVWWTKHYGWRDVYEIIQSNIKGACRAAEAVIVRKRK